MKKIDHKSLAMSLALLGTALCPTSVFASDGNYDITYSGGVQLGQSGTMQFRGDLNDSTLKPVVPVHATDFSNIDVKVEYANDSAWKTGYLYDEDYGCRKYRYLEVSGDSQPNQKVTVSAKDRATDTVTYSADITIAKITTEEFGQGFKTSVGFTGGTSALYAGGDVYSKCVTKDDKTLDTENSTKADVDGLYPGKTGSGKVFVETKIDLHANGGGKLLTSDARYVTITDIDEGQSYKILNADNLITKDTLFAINASDLQPTSGSLHNMFNTEHNYIYSQYQTTSPTTFNTTKSNVYVRLENSTVKNGLELVLGFTHGAASGIGFYARQYKVNYTAGEGGSVDPSSEDVPSGNNPAGSTQTPADGYEFDHWTADKDVTLNDGTIIKAGEKITEEQIKNIIVHDNINFTAHYSKVEATPKFPNTGSSTKEIDAAGIATISIAAVLGLALFIRALPRITHKKIGFKR